MQSTEPQWTSFHRDNKTLQHSYKTMCKQKDLGSQGRARSRKTESSNNWFNPAKDWAASWHCWHSGHYLSAPGGLSSRAQRLLSAVGGNFTLMKGIYFEAKTLLCTLCFCWNNNKVALDILQGSWQQSLTWLQQNYILLKGKGWYSQGGRAHCACVCTAVKARGFLIHDQGSWALQNINTQ